MTASVTVNTSYVSSGCNRTPLCVDWGLNDVVCYGTGNGLAVYDTNNAAVIHTAAAHTGRINCVRWIRNADSTRAENELISCSSDKTALIWRYNAADKQEKFKVICKLQGHTAVVNAADALQWRLSDAADDNRTIIVTASSDATVKLWTRNSSDDSDKLSIKCDQTINLKSHFALDVKFALHPATDVPLLIFGGSDMKVHIYVKNEHEFAKAVSLVGHEDWIRAIDTAYEDEQNILLIATCAQDSLIRVWCLEDEEQVKRKNVGREKELKLKDIIYAVRDEKGTSTSYIIKLDSIVAGHENWIYGLQWHPRINTGDGLVQPLKFLSASMDKTMIIWEYDKTIEVWIEKVRVGEVGGNTLGFYGCRMSPDGCSIIAHGYQGAFHLWRYDEEMKQWRPGVTVSGHFREVQDLAWNPRGEFVISVSSDQTTRLHAPWVRDDGQETRWHEMARPQVHGYDMTCITMLGRYKFASGADEKVLRAFEAPRNFLENYVALSGGDPADCIDDSAPEGASVPALGLSNKAVFDKNLAASAEGATAQKHPKDIYPESYFVSTSLDEPPTEEMLVQNTLWPEVHKLYGHGYEIFCVASNREGTIIASACKSSNAEHAYIILWDTKTWSNIGQLHGHSLTVTQMAFSPCGKRLLSVSRDRTWSIYGLTWTSDGRLSYEREAFSDKASGIHLRIIWTCAWSHDSEYFVTGSRDGKVVVWGMTDGTIERSPCLGNWKAIGKPLILKDSVTALDVAPRLLAADKRYLFAIGLESGAIHLYKWSSIDTWCHCAILDNTYHHNSTVKRIQFNPKRNSEEDASADRFQLASGGYDFSVRVTDISIKTENVSD